MKKTSHTNVLEVYNENNLKNNEELNDSQNSFTLNQSSKNSTSENKGSTSDDSSSLLSFYDEKTQTGFLNPFTVKFNENGKKQKLSKTLNIKVLEKNAKDKKTSLNNIKNKKKIKKLRRKESKNSLISTKSTLNLELEENVNDEFHKDNRSKSTTRSIELYEEKGKDDENPESSLVSQTLNFSFKEQNVNLNYQTNFQNEKILKMVLKVTKINAHEKPNESSTNETSVPLKAEHKLRNKKIKKKKLESDDITTSKNEKQYINNPQYCLIYNQEILKELKEQELINVPDFSIMELISGDFKTYEKCRTKILQTFYYSQIYFDFKEETIQLAINILDRYSITLLKEKKELNYSLAESENLSVALIFLASKYEEIYPPRLDEYCYPQDKEKIINIESEVLHALDYELHITSPYTFLQRYSSISGIKDDVFNLANFFLDFGNFKIEFSRKKNSLKACVCLYLAMKFYKEKNMNIYNENSPNTKLIKIWTNELVLFTGYSEDDLKNGISIILDELSKLKLKLENYFNIARLKKIKNIPECVFKNYELFGAMIKKYCFITRDFTIQKLLKDFPKLDKHGKKI